jgi:hypothetical protein
MYLFLELEIEGVTRVYCGSYILKLLHVSVFDKMYKVSSFLSLCSSQNPRHFVSWLVLGT